MWIREMDFSVKIQKHNSILKIQIVLHQAVGSYEYSHWFMNGAVKIFLNKKEFTEMVFLYAKMCLIVLSVVGEIGCRAFGVDVVCVEVKCPSEHLISSKFNTILLSNCKNGPILL